MKIISSIIALMLLSCDKQKTHDTSFDSLTIRVVDGHEYVVFYYGYGSDLEHHAGCKSCNKNR